MWSGVSRKDNEGGVISITTGDSRKGCFGAVFRFLGLYVCLYVRRG